MLANAKPQERGSALDQLRKSRPPEIVAETTDAIRPHKRPYASCGAFSTQGLMLEVCFKTGYCRFFEAAGCVDAAYQPGDTILALFSTVVLILSGRNLGEAMSLLKERRCAYIQENHDRHAPDDEPHIDSIWFRDPKRWFELLDELERTGRIAEERL